ncbi:ComEA family DNA-binding protein [Chitinophaga sp. Hz27]|uniref:ComEA family DNA-binding protein n=1 Tax=Chitinophaga sp. Hz27 TaxID=3347169 RepID=UPI0035E20F1C
MWNRLKAAVLHVSVKERIGILVLSCLVVVCCLVHRIASCYIDQQDTDSLKLKAAVTAFESQLMAYEKDSNAWPSKRVYTERTDKQHFNAAINVASALFYFDPNKMSIEKWQKQGLSAKTATGIIHYVEKGGKFRKPEDLGKIYGLHAEMLARILPYVRIPDEITATYKRSDSIYPTYRKKSLQVIDINMADTLVWQGLPGIGPGFARRIVLFREKLGGFYSVDQVAETYGLADSVFKKIQPFLKIGDSSLKKMDLNLTDEKTLANHPYIRSKLASMIVAYRNAHAGFKRVGELKSLPLVDDIIYRKIEHYIEMP